MACMLARRHAQGHADTSSSGKCLPAVDEHEINPLMVVIDKYRLCEQRRLSIVTTMLQENTKRWWIHYQDYKVQRKIFREAWQQWRLQVSALGPHHRNVWPMCPAIPRFPMELVKVDEKWLHAQVLIALRQTEAGQLL